MVFFTVDTSFDFGDSCKFCFIGPLPMHFDNRGYSHATWELSPDVPPPDTS